MTEKDSSEGMYIVGIYQNPVLITTDSPKEKANELERLAKQGKIKRIGSFTGNSGKVVNYRRGHTENEEEGETQANYRISATHRIPRAGVESEASEILIIELPSEDSEAALKDFSNLVSFYTPNSKEFTTITKGEEKIPKLRMNKNNPIKIWGALQDGEAR